jgi:hypothetical protein
MKSAATEPTSQRVQPSSVYCEDRKVYGVCLHSGVMRHGAVHGIKLRAVFQFSVFRIHTVKCYSLCSHRLFALGVDFQSLFVFFKNTNVGATSRQGRMSLFLFLAKAECSLLATPHQGLLFLSKRDFDVRNLFKGKYWQILETIPFYSFGVNVILIAIEMQNSRICAKRSDRCFMLYEGRQSNSYGF